MDSLISTPPKGLGSGVPLSITYNPSISLFLWRALSLMACSRSLSCSVCTGCTGFIPRSIGLISALHNGHLLLWTNEVCIHLSWNLCPHLNVLIWNSPIASLSISAKHIEHSSAPPCWTCSFLVFCPKILIALDLLLAWFFVVLYLLLAWFFVVLDLLLVWFFVALDLLLARIGGNIILYII